MALEYIIFALSEKEYRSVTLSDAHSTVYSEELFLPFPVNFRDFLLVPIFFLAIVPRHVLFKFVFNFLIESEGFFV